MQTEETDVNTGLLSPGDILAVNASKGRGIFSAGWWIKLRARLMGGSAKSSAADHVVVVHHRDAAGTLWGVEGKPSSVGWVDCAIYLDKGKLVADNRFQPKTDAQRELICKVAEEMLGTPYDWAAIATLGYEVNFVNSLWNKLVANRYRKSWHFGFKAREWGKDEIPGHIICSSLAALVYRKAELNFPKDSKGGVRFVDPDDWASFCFQHTTPVGWND